MFVKSNNEISASTLPDAPNHSLCSAVVLCALLNPTNELVGYDVYHGYAI